MKYRKKPVVVEAVQYLGSDTSVPFSERTNWLFNAVYNGDVYQKDGELYIRTLEGNLHVSEYDYIIRGINNELYPCKPDVFERTYELIKERR